MSQQKCASAVVLYKHATSVIFGMTSDCVQHNTMPLGPSSLQPATAKPETAIPYYLTTFPTLDVQLPNPRPAPCRRPAGRGAPSWNRGPARSSKKAKILQELTLVLWRVGDGGQGDWGKLGGC